MFKERIQIQKAVTPSEAEEFLKINFRGQRRYDPRKARQYADEMLAGTWRRFCIDIAELPAPGGSSMVNGQHNCHAVILTGKPQDALISYYPCANDHEVGVLYGSFDTNPGRTIRDVIAGRRIFFDEKMRELDVKFLGACASALYAMRYFPDPQFRRHAINKNLIADVLEQYPEDVLCVQKFYAHVHLARIGVIAAIIGTMRVNRDAADRFWQKVATGELLETGDPCGRLRDSLVEMHHLKSAMSGKEAQQMTYALCVSWWNTWRTGSKRNGVKLNGMTKLPKILS
jgi:hypothetical protein